MHKFYELFSFFSPVFLGLSVDSGTGGSGAGGGAAEGAGAGQSSGQGAASQGAGANSGAAGSQSGAGAAAPSSFRDFISPEGKFVKGWATTNGGTEALEAKFSEPKALIGSYANLEKLIGSKGILKPGPNATPAERDAYYNELGRPGKPEDYGLAKPATIKMGDKDVDVPDAVWDAAALKDAQALFHRIGITKEQAAELAQFDVMRGMNGHAKVEQAMAEGRASADKALREQWGSEYDSNVKLAQDAAARSGLTKEELNANPHLGNDPLFIKAMAAVGKMIVETPAAGARGTQASSGTNPQAEINAIFNNPEHAWHPHSEAARSNPKAHQDAVDEMKRLFELKVGSG